MINVVPAAEPAAFDAAVRQKGATWFAAKNLVGATKLPKNVSLPSYWTAALDDLMESYDCVCAYASLRIHKITGGRSADHFAPKSKALAAAYEWSNYRLACRNLNARKRDFTDVLDPFQVIPGTFILDAGDGSIKVSPAITGSYRTLAQSTIDRLGLDSPAFRDERVEIIDDYLAGELGKKRLRKESPFIALELERQGIKPVP